MVAEYLGAKWLAACFDARPSERRIFSLFRPGDGVPTSLRGLHAWLMHFSPALADGCIAADPYAVLRYGDAETINLDQARVLLAALITLSEDDPYFAAEDWGRHTDMWEVCWTEEGPRGEKYCRNRLVEQLSGLMPDAIQPEPEMWMPGRRRADIVAIRNAIGLPIEIKGQWHREVWNAASDQLDAYYACE